MNDRYLTGPITMKMAALSTCVNCRKLYAMGTDILIISELENIRHGGSVWWLLCSAYMFDTFS